ncbi:MAG TPA: flavin reductase [Mycobacteriales bacterium]|nr:flavin reductase [Mycobacteriales bacterium]
MEVPPPERREFVDPEVFRHVIGHFASGVTVVTAAEGGRRYGMTASAVTSLSLEPPMLLVCMNHRTRTQAAVSRTGRFAVNILGEEHGLVAERFALSTDGVADGDKFVGLATSNGRLGAPLLADALAHLECRVTRSVTGGSHRVFLAEVVHAQAGAGTPLTYYRGRFGRFQEVGDTEVYEALRGRVLNREVTVGAAVRPADLTGELSASETQVRHALARLVADGLMARQDDGFTVRPLDAATSDAAFDAKLVLELGVLDLTVGRIGADRLARLRTLMESTVPYIRDGHFTDPRAYERANSAFHGYVIGLADSPLLPRLYDRLRIPEITARALFGDVRASVALVHEHRRLVEAYERGDLPTARSVVKEHSERSKQTQRAGIELAGGSI